MTRTTVRDALVHRRNTCNELLIAYQNRRPVDGYVIVNQYPIGIRIAPTGLEHTAAWEQYREWCNEWTNAIRNYRDAANRTCFTRTNTEAGEPVGRHVEHDGVDMSRVQAPMV